MFENPLDDGFGPPDFRGIVRAEELPFAFQALQTENHSQFQKNRETWAGEGGADADTIICIPVRPDKAREFLPNRMDLGGHTAG